MPVPFARPEVAAAEVDDLSTSRPAVYAGRSRVRQVRTAIGLLAVAGLLALAGCGKQAEPVEDVRPVRVMQLSPAAGKTDYEFSGEVRPRIESRLGFRVGGKISARLVDVGATVRKGQPLARLDPTDLALAESGARAQYDAAKTDRDLAAADLKRYKELAAKNFISAAELNRRQATFDSAASRLDQAQASLRNQSNQTGYAVLTADADGVVTAIDTEVGQVVTPGQPVIRVAQTAEKEVAIGLPEDQVDMLRGITDVSIHTWSDPHRILPGRVREISAAADPVTRTYPTRVSIPNPPADLRIGMTAVVSFTRTGDAATIRVPLTALLQDKGANHVWIYQPGQGGSGTVKPVPVTLGAAQGNLIEVRHGLSPGQTIVTAGVHLLKPGQKVKPMQSVAPAQPASNPGAQLSALDRRLG
ncbi:MULTISPECIES: efflux RND transporter periplasmic adaptor subunit [unclassified Cupriavidus]|uniref:efflux RND transporter periplasmic adaptor subunit n=1 Tax=unclassified Cupriavidus TaxID=2640874 RepID=UPI001C001D33|nr:MULTISPECIES: efflux RND transporter periplasmic adaptor subunit [unclassified Cupriavidus]MCA3187350.1 efflux RND transporter periplasmic adaptor subunit [Cupriavidus sp.]MCA3189396.1 efflux RND transporter periplasmic adaptor subunit [Cupriavidus sp.]MCA3195476.1 efflux RND transporter periplasmic adaptor subunit [Cupriavidus sp.]MCA3201031.1 efflux RND transporter periplasmic adaptor subunit [Cupriavidus sp.]MCA3210162.1 efflux RND transporter periplasmic adaptor subunit [Cupriavidus sp.